MAVEYEKGAHKSTVWEHCYEEVITIIAQLSELAARIYRRSFHDGKLGPNDSPLVHYSLVHITTCLLYTSPSPRDS